VTEPSAEVIRGSTRLRSVPLVPEIQLYQASEPMSVWQQTEQVTGRIGLDPPFWAFAWAGGQALARYLLDHPEAVTGRHAIDVASGSGLVAIAAVLAGAAAVTAYDIDPLAAAAIAVNAAANGVAVPVVLADVRLHDDLPSPGTDLVLVADAFYEQELAAEVLRLAERSRDHGAAVLIGDFGRAYLPRARLVPGRNTFTQPGIRLRALRRQPYLVLGTHIYREPVSYALRKLGSLSAGDCLPLLLPGLSFR